MSALDERYKMWARVLGVSRASSDHVSSDHVQRPQSAQRASDNLNGAIRNVLEERCKMWERVLDDNATGSGSGKGTPRLIAPSVLPPPHSTLRATELSTPEAKDSTSSYDMGALQSIDPGSGGFHVRVPVRKRIAGYTRQQKHFDGSPWAVSANGMWFEQNPAVTVAPGKTASWQTRDSTDPPPQQLNGKLLPRGGRLGWLGQHRSRGCIGARHAPGKSEDSASADIDTHSVASLCRRHASAPLSVVVGATHLPATSLRLGQLTGGDLESLYHLLEPERCSRWDLSDVDSQGVD